MYGLQQLKANVLVRDQSNEPEIRLEQGKTTNTLLFLIFKQNNKLSANCKQATQRR